MIDFILGLIPGGYITGILALVAAFFGFKFSVKRSAVKQERQKAKEADHENAEAIRDNVDRNLDKRVRKYDDAGFRDSE